MARTIRTARTTADVQERMARVGRQQRTIARERDAIAQSLADAQPITTEFVGAPSMDPIVYSTQTPATFGHVFDGLLDRLAVAERVHNDVLAMGERYEYERACAEHATKIQMFPVSLTRVVRPAPSYFTPASA